jgi:hypothetical protein
VAQPQHVTPVQAKAADASTHGREISSREPGQGVNERTPVYLFLFALAAIAAGVFALGIVN